MFYQLKNKKSVKNINLGIKTSNYNMSDIKLSRIFYIGMFFTFFSYALQLNSFMCTFKLI